MIVRLLLVTILALVSRVCVAEADGSEVGPIQSAHSACSPTLGEVTLVRPKNRLSTFCGFPMTPAIAGVLPSL
eukprot:1169561-Prymnesium_polylepis.1